MKAQRQFVPKLLLPSPSTQYVGSRPPQTVNRPFPATIRPNSPATWPTPARPLTPQRPPPRPRSNRPLPPVPTSSPAQVAALLRTRQLPDVFKQRDLQYEYISNLTYPGIREFCSTDKATLSFCRNTPRVWNVIERKRIEYKTDKFLEKLVKQKIPNIEEYAVSGASSNGDVEIVDELFRRNYKPVEALVSAIYGGNIKVVDRLLQDERVDPSEHDSVAVAAAAVAKGGRLDILNRLLQYEKVDPSANNNAALLQTIMFNGNFDIINRLLQDKRVDPSANNNRAVNEAVVKSDVRILNRLLQDPRVDPSANNNAAIKNASANNFAGQSTIDKIRRLLQEPRVRNTLPQNELRKYTQLVGHIFPAPQSETLLRVN